MIYDAVSEDHLGMEQLMMLASFPSYNHAIVRVYNTWYEMQTWQHPKLDSEGRTMNDQHLKATPGRTGENWSVEGGVEKKWLS